MDSVVRALLVYLFLMILFRVTGKRTLSQVTTFDFVLLLIIAAASQQALLGEDSSVMNSVIVITTLVAIDRLADFLGYRFPRFDRITESVPLVLVDDGKPLLDRLRKAQVTEDDILSSARSTRGLERMDQIRYAVLEKSGGISVIPTHQGS